MTLNPRSYAFRGVGPLTGRQMLTAWIFGLLLILAGCVIDAASAQQTRFYAPNGKSLGTASPYGNGSVRFRDASGRTTGTSTTTSQGTTFYDARGNVTGRSSTPGRPR
jgi:hypothetical protein